jgi:acetylornithine deacetylase/succinyl-diaminopimelate desuccinylase-like protein
VEVTTPGGHSYGAFGNPNAIHELSKIISDIYKIEIPAKEGAKTTYNVGNITGGTSVNTIAQQAEMLCEYRSNDVGCLAYMKEEFEKIFEKAKSEHTKVKVTLIGERPCGTAKQEDIDVLKTIPQRIMEEVTGKEINCHPSSTDCNIPLSLGIPAVCFGTKISGGTHTREEWAKKSVLPLGMQIAIRALYETVESDVCRRLI